MKSYAIHLYCKSHIGKEMIINMKLSTKILKCLTISVLFISSICIGQTKKQPPNVIFVIIDDLGSAWLPPYAINLKASDVENDIINEYKKKQNVNAEFSIEKHLEAARSSMPFLDKLSAQGVKFNRCFTSSALCAPFRAAMMTGKYSQSWGAYTIPEIEESGIPTNILTLPTIFQKSGYNTGIIGKWHVAPHDNRLKKGADIDHYKSSSAPGYHPLDRGFNYYYGYNSSNSTYLASKDIWEGREPVPAFTNKDFLTDILNGKAKEFMQKSIDEKKPFFLYYAPMTVHGNLTPCPAKYSDKFKSGVTATNNFAGHLLALDEGIKEMYNVLEKAGQADNTLFILCSDNGAVFPVPPYNAPFKGGKATGWLGGSNSPLIMVMPGKTKTMYTDELVSCMDILPTALDAAGLKVPEGLDGVSLKKLIFEGKQSKPHQTIFSSGLHSARWSYSYYDETQKKNMDNANCPVYVWGLNDNYFSLHLTKVSSGIYEKLPDGKSSQNILFNYVKDPLNKTMLKAENSEQKILRAKTKEWLQKQKDPLRDRKKEHYELIEQLNSDYKADK